MVQKTIADRYFQVVYSIFNPEIGIKLYYDVGFFFKRISKRGCNFNDGIFEERF